MPVRRVFVQAENGVPCDEAFFKAWAGFRKRRIPCEMFAQSELKELPLTRETLVAGGLRVVEDAMARIGMRVPEADNLPECLARYRGRRVWTSTWGRLRAEYANSDPAEPLFVKPLRRNKGFPAVAVYSADDLQSVTAGDNEPVLVSEYVVFDSEWRCFVCQGRVLSTCHYQGDPFRFPDPEVMTRAIRDFAPHAPAGHAIDFGLLTTGRTVIVEVNDGYSLGSYNLNAVEYSELLEARWLELADGSRST